VDEISGGNRLVGLVALKDPNIEDPRPEDMYTVGTAAILHRLFKAPDGTIRLFVQGLERIKINGFTQTEPYIKASVEVIPDVIEQSVEVTALMRNVSDLFRRFASLVPALPEELMMAALGTDDPRQLAYLVANYVRMDMSDAQTILELDGVKAKLEKLNGVLNRELEVLELGKKIQSQAQGEMEKMQREYYLREQLKAIKKELGEEDEQTLDIKDLASKIEAAGMPEEALKEAKRELERLQHMPMAAAEYSVIKTYIEWLISLPWKTSTDDCLDIERARAVLEEDHYDLAKIKERILEYLAVRKLRQERADELKADEQTQDYLRMEREGAILCLIGPPGTGKTSLGRSIARALGRKFVRMSLGGMRDEAEIRGHRRTYIGALPGRIIQSLKRAGTKNPVFMLDEIDKVGTDWRGDPTSALLEVLDPEQNREFRDHYLDVPFDLSEVMFITTGNQLEPIPAPLRDRMEILQLSGYIEEEKVKIAQGYVIPRQLRENALRTGEISFTVEALQKIIREYTREAGVRNLEREIGNICRKVVTKLAGASEAPTEVITEEKLVEYLGKPHYFSEAKQRTAVPGVATGLTVTFAGGDITFVEATRMKGSKGLLLTGQLGEVMKESAQAALSYLRTKAGELGIDEDFFASSDLHIHVPAGAQPKEGPSAGVTLATAMLSLLTSRPVKDSVAMTGEITLRGQVMPVGGIKDKVLAARRAGLDTVILPRRNEADLDELPEEARKEMHFILVDTLDQVFKAALVEATGEEARSEGNGKSSHRGKRSGHRAAGGETAGA
jgi:ATP-dependent Lon protease